MRPTLFDVDLPVVGRLEMPAYLTMVLAAFVVAILYCRRQAEKEGLDGTAIIDLGVLMFVTGIMGARLLAVLTDGHFTDFVHLCTDPIRVNADDALVAHCTTDAQCGYDYLCNASTGACYPPRDCLAALKFWRGGLTYYGGFLAAAPLGLWFARRKKIPALQLADIAAPAIAIGLFVGRWGCFLNGCCYGATTRSWIGVSLPGRHVSQHATQLYESAAGLLIFLLLHYVVRRKKSSDGEVFAWLLILYGVARTFIELFRADQRGALGPLSTSQWLSLPLIATGGWLLSRCHRMARRRSRATTGQ